MNRLEESSVIRLLLEIMGAVSTFGRYRPYWARIVGACYVARTLLYTGLSSVRRFGTCILGRGTDRIYPLGRLPTLTTPVNFFFLKMMYSALEEHNHRIQIKDLHLVLQTKQEAVTNSDIKRLVLNNSV